LENHFDPLLQQGIKNGLIEIKEDRIRYIAQNKEYNFYDPEENVRAKVYIKCVKKYQYPPKRLDLEVYPPRLEPKLPADIVVYYDDERVKPFIVVETKATSEESNIDKAKKEGLGNANLLLSDYLLTVCGEEEAVYYVKERPSIKNLENYRRSELPVAYGKETKYKYRKGGDIFSELRKATLNELNNKFQLCHNEIWEGGKRDPAISFDEMSKLMFTKIYDERFTKTGEHYKFQIGTNEAPNIIAQRVKGIYREAQRNEPEVFKADIELSDDRISKIVEILQDISLINTDLDAKGRAFEKFLGAYFRGPAGQYFTPRQIVEFMVDMINPTEKDLIMDPACGSGGFLLYSIKLVRELIKKNYARDERTINRIDWDFSHKQIFGIEINDRIARIAMMDMVIHDDGHSNIECNNALHEYVKFDPRRAIMPERYDIVLTNPPLGKAAKEKEKGILNNFEFGKGRNNQITSVFFIERCLDLLKTDGRLGIVLDDGILTNPTLRYVRDFIRNRAVIKAIISLPNFSFKAVGAGAKTSILFLQKKRQEQFPKDYPIFMAIAEHIGYDATGRPDKNELPDIFYEFAKFCLEQKGLMKDLSRDQTIELFRQYGW